jgi:hypothetical protein
VYVYRMSDAGFARYKRDLLAPNKKVLAADGSNSVAVVGNKSKRRRLQVASILFRDGSLGRQCLQCSLNYNQMS